MQKKPPLINIVIAALLVLLTVLIGLLSSIAANQLPPAATPYLRLTWPLLGVMALVYIGLTVWQTWRQSVSEHDDTAPKGKRRQRTIEKQNRQRMLEKVRAFWITGLLEQSLHGAALMALGMQEQPEDIANPWRLIFQEFDQPSRPLPPGTRITQIYDKVGGNLLLLGEPGSGKTTLLLELARDLLDRAILDENHPMPVVFNLSSWFVKRQPLTYWLIEELYARYQVPRNLGKSWISTDQLLLLLDGLDEVAPKHRTACVEAINRYRQEHGMVSVIVCSRTFEYRDQSARVLLHDAVVVQQLTLQQIDMYISSAGRQLAALQSALQADQSLQELAKTPLMLNVLTLTYQGTAVENSSKTSNLEEKRQQIFQVYVQRMLQRRGASSHYTLDQTRYWLKWLALQLPQNGTEFRLERMNRKWLPEGRLSQLYDVMVTAILSGLLVGLLNGLASGLLVGLLNGLPRGLLVGLLNGLASGLLVGLLNGLLNKWDNKVPIRLLRVAVVGLLNGFVIGSHSGVAGGWIGGLAGVFIGWWGGKRSRSSGSDWPGLFEGKVGMIVGGLLDGLAIGLMSWVFVTVQFGLINGVIDGLVSGLFTGLIGGFISFLQYSGETPIGYIVLRLLLWHAGYTPWNYHRFLDYCVERLLLRKVGEGYIFVHDLLRQHLASLNTTQNSAS